MPNVMPENTDWNTFVYGILKRDDIVDGVLLLSHYGCTLFSEGALEHVSEDEVKQFCNLFGVPDTSTELSPLYQTGFKVSIRGLEGSVSSVKFVVHRKGYHSIYATSTHNLYGLVIINLANAVLVASHSHPITSLVAADHCERAAQVLRS